MMKTLKNLRKNSKGATAIEYGLIAAVVSVGIIASAGTLRDSIAGTFGTVGTAMTTAAAQ